MSKFVEKCGYFVMSEQRWGLSVRRGEVARDEADVRTGGSIA
jgi:hypothetical protein